MLAPSLTLRSPAVCSNTDQQLISSLTRGLALKLKGLSADISTAGIPVS